MYLKVNDKMGFYLEQVVYTEYAVVEAPLLPEGEADGGAPPPVVEEPPPIDEPPIDEAGEESPVIAPPVVEPQVALPQAGPPVPTITLYMTSGGPLIFEGAEAEKLYKHFSTSSSTVSVL